MLPNWTNHLKDAEEKTRFKTYIYSSRGVLDRLKQIVSDMETELDNKELNPDSYDSPSWAARQADNNGYRRCLRRFQQLLTLDPKENND